MCKSKDIVSGASNNKKCEKYCKDCNVYKEIKNIKGK
jgi:hypothetical protein